MVKALGKEIKAFYEDEEFIFLEDHDEMEDSELDIEDLKDDEYYETSRLGTFTDTVLNKTVTFTKMFKQWKEKQEYDFVLIQVKKEQKNEVIEKLKEMGVKI